MFNKYKFIEELNEDLRSECKEFLSTSDDNEECYEHLQNYISEDLETCVIYYNHCFDIIKALQFTSFDANDNDLGIECKDVSQAAYCALYELIQDEAEDLYLIIKQNQ
tara:strand:+ start:49 stop:372 length:324 start_codon:yes stop_codon:yes gene_type:complete